jgi:hypothetical protein
MIAGAALETAFDSVERLRAIAGDIFAGDAARRHPMTPAGIRLDEHRAEARAALAHLRRILQAKAQPINSPDRLSGLRIEKCKVGRSFMHFFCGFLLFSHEFSAIFD